MVARNGYTLGMKTAVSVPNEVFERGERLAKRLKMSRSELYSRALREYLARHAPDEVTAALNAVCDELDTGADEFVREAGRRRDERTLRTSRLCGAGGRDGWSAPGALGRNRFPTAVYRYVSIFFQSLLKIIIGNHGGNLSFQKGVKILA